MICMEYHWSTHISTHRSTSQDSNKKRLETIQFVNICCYEVMLRNLLWVLRNHRLGTSAIQKAIFVTFGNLTDIA